jgi:hypothetical protein
MPLSPAQLTALKNDMAANTNTVLINGVPTAINVVPHGAQNAQTIADWYNLPHATWTVWKSLVPLGEIGMAMDGSEAAGLTTANNTRLQVRAAFLVSGENPSIAGTRSFYADVFSTGGITAAALLSLWKKLATNSQKLFSTGTGSNASPATMTYEPSLTGTDVINAWAA